MSLPENKYFFHLNEKSSKAARTVRGENLISLSELKNAYYLNVVHNYSIKLSLAGTEFYKINKKEFVVREMSFLTATAPCESVGFFESKSPVKGLCVDISLNLIQEAYDVLSSQGSINLDNNFIGHFQPKNYFENVSPVLNSELGHSLLAINKRLHHPGADFSFINEETFLELAGIVVTHEFENLKKLNALTSLKISTKKEILKRLMFAKNFIDDNFRRRIDVKEIAKLSYLSEYHFYRSFKDAFGISPYNYTLKRRISEAQNLLRNENYSIGEIAFKCGFSDIHTFSKTFKKHIGYSPTKFVTKN